VREFVDRVMPHALEVSRASGIPADFMVGQAALESGWGRREIRTGDGSPSYNIFGIKAGRSWSGPTVERSTLEYIDGVPRRVNQRFRAYDSYAAAFQDYARLLQTNRRYAAALNTSDDPARFAQALQDAGYATDPQYANKLTRVINGAQFRQATVSYAALAAAKPA
jgi:flagellar protein FlgJ